MGVGGGGIDAEMVPKGFFRIRDTSLLQRTVYVLAGFWFAFGGWYGKFENREVILITKRREIAPRDVFIGTEGFDGSYSEFP